LDDGARKRVESGRIDTHLTRPVVLLALENMIGDTAG
jgi:hypothetical protein